MVVLEEMCHSLLLWSRHSFRVECAGNIVSLFLELIYLVMISTCLQGKPQKTLHNDMNQSKRCFFFFFFYTSCEVFKIKQQWGCHPFCSFSPSSCLNGSTDVWPEGVEGFSIFSANTGSWARERIRGDAIPLLDCAEMRSTVAYAHRSLQQDLLIFLLKKLCCYCTFILESKRNST